jgi:hypothetical protein
MHLVEKADIGTLFNLKQPDQKEGRSKVKLEDPLDRFKCGYLNHACHNLNIQNQSFLKLIGHRRK